MREVSVGENLDQYKLIEVIARSGMASIFKAIDQIDGKTVAIKVPYMQFESDVVFYGRFQREEEVGRRLDHPGIVKVLAPRTACPRNKRSASRVSWLRRSCTCTAKASCIAT